MTDRRVTDAASFVRGPDPSNEWCRLCNRHIRRHWGGTAYNCPTWGLRDQVHSEQWTVNASSQLHPDCVFHGVNHYARQLDLEDAVRQALVLMRDGDSLAARELLRKVGGG